MKETTTSAEPSPPEAVLAGWREEFRCSLCCRARVLQCPRGCSQGHFWTPQECLLPVTWRLFLLGRKCQSNRNQELLQLKTENTPWILHWILRLSYPPPLRAGACFSMPSPAPALRGFCPSSPGLQSPGEASSGAGTCAAAARSLSDRKSVV